MGDRVLNLKTRAPGSLTRIMRPRRPKCNHPMAFLATSRTKTSNFASISTGVTLVTNEKPRFKRTRWNNQASNLIK
ncbi:MAG: hypothetical protein CMJ48_12490 [Planctomycetaceae bacterium]|nr:hypothetical protein [Planctomycetaceae bacterium]